MAEYHPGTDIEIPNNVPMSGFRNAIPNPKRYMRHNRVTLDDVAEAAFTGDVDLLEEMLSTGTEKQLFNGDINAFQTTINPLQLAAMAGQTECVELLLLAKADPHVRETMAYGQDPEDGRTALDFAREWGHDDITEILEQAEKDAPYGWYLPSGKGNNAKLYGCWEFVKKPQTGWNSSRPGMAEMCGFDPMKYGTGPLMKDDGEEAFEELVTVGGSKDKALPAVEEIPTLPIGLLFPGQGSQYVNMMSTCKDIPAVAKMLATAKDILGYDVLDLCIQGPETKLEETRHCQPAMFIAGLAGVEKLRNERPEAVEKFNSCAGLSLGEYTALCVAGVFDFEDGLKLVQIRGEAMQEAAESSKQLMMSVAGLEKPKVVSLCAEAAKAHGAGAVCQIANELFPKGFSCAGTAAAITDLKEKCEKAGALQAKVLKISGAFHTSLMGPAQEKLGRALDEMLPKMKPPRRTIYMNSTALPVKPGTDPKEIVELLKKQLTNPVLWEPSVRAMIKAGVTEYYEVGPMKQIKAMMKRIDAKVWQNTSTIEV